VGGSLNGYEVLSGVIVMATLRATGLVKGRLPKQIVFGGSWIDGGWRGCIDDKVTGRHWWICLHDHMDGAGGELCARRIWEAAVL
jgi:hypothetical protein